MYPHFIIGDTAIRLYDCIFFLSHILILGLLLLRRPKDFLVTRSGIFLVWLIFFIFSIIGGRFTHILSHMSIYRGKGIMEILSTGGIASLGSLTFGIFSIWIYAQGAKELFLTLTDYLMPFVIFALGIIRIGCLLAGCCYGIYTDLPWGFQFLSDGITRHPTQVYEMMYNFAIFGSSRFIYNNLRGFKGFSSVYVIFVYSFFRFFNEFLRAEGPRMIGQLKVAHPVLLIFMIISFSGIFRLIRSAKADMMRIIQKVFRIAMLKLFVWLFFSALFSLMIIYISNRIWFNQF